MNEYEFWKLLVAMIPPSLVGGAVFWAFWHGAWVREPSDGRRLVVYAAALAVAVSVSATTSGQNFFGPEAALGLHIIGAVLVYLGIQRRRASTESTASRVAEPDRAWGVHREA